MIHKLSLTPRIFSLGSLWAVMRDDHGLDFLADKSTVDAEGGWKMRMRILFCINPV